jgi:hypothetical protein
MKIHEHIYLDMYENIVIIEDGKVTGVVGKASLTKLISMMGIEKIVELCDVVKPDFTVENASEKSSDSLGRERSYH